MRSSGVILVWMVVGLSLASRSTHAETETSPPKYPKTVVSGFEPFGGRQHNASWILAQAIAKRFPEEVEAMQIPVVWNAPLTTIQKVKPLPQTWIAFGEGSEVFEIELVAHNHRGFHFDNNRALPPHKEVVPGGPAQLKQNVDLAALATALNKAGFPTHLSEDAGRYLCEEMLYALLHTQARHPDALRLVLFIHVPTLGRTAGGQKVDAVRLDAFGKELLASLKSLGVLPPPQSAD